MNALEFKPKAGLFLKKTLQKSSKCPELNVYFIKKIYVFRSDSFIVIVQKTYYGNINLPTFELKKRSGCYKRNEEALVTLLHVKNVLCFQVKVQ